MADLQKQSSFIPQRPSKGNVKPKRMRKIYVLNYVTYVIFFGTLIVTAGVFFFGWSLDSQIDTLAKQLDAEQSVFNENELANVKILDTKIDTAEGMLNNHVSVVSILAAIEQSIVGPIQLLDFVYTRTGQSDAPLVSLTAETDSFNTVLFQNQVLAANGIIRGLDIQNVSLETKSIDPANLALGNDQFVSLKIMATFDTAAVNYKGARQFQSLEAPVDMVEASLDTDNSQLEAVGDEQISEVVEDEESVSSNDSSL